MAKGFGIIGLILASGAIFIPFVSRFVIWLALLLVTVSALAGDRLFAVATVIASFLNVVFWSPATMLMLIGDVGASRQFAEHGSPMVFILALILFAAPIVAVILNATGKVVLAQPDRAHRVVLGR